MGGVQKTGHLFRRLSLDAHGDAKRAQLQVAHLLVKDLAHQIGSLFAAKRTRAVFAASDVLDVVADSHASDCAGKQITVGYMGMHFMQAV